MERERVMVNFRCDGKLKNAKITTNLYLILKKKHKKIKNILFTGLHTGTYFNVKCLSRFFPTNRFS